MKHINSNMLALRMMVAMVAGILVGLLFMVFREYAGSDSILWQNINNLLFQDITAPGGERALGLFYLGGQLFIRALQLIIVPMVFSSIVLAISEISEASTLGRVSAKTMGWFMLTSGIALVLASIFGMVFFKAGVFSATIEGISISSGTTGSNPLNVILNIIPSNIISTFSVNNAVLGIVFIAVVVGLGMNKLNLGKDSTIYRFCDESNRIIVVFLKYIVTKFGPCAIFMLLCRTFATYGIDYLKPALRYHVFSYRYEDYIDLMFAWSGNLENRTLFYQSYSDAADMWLGELGIPQDQYPDYDACFCWYKNERDNSEIIIFWNPEINRLYIVENII